MNNLTGQIVKTYQVTGEIDTGGFGAVYRAFQPIIEREVALKVILPQFANKPAFIHRFEIEAQTVARLEHPYIVPLYDFWRDPNGAYLVMRYMRGGNLRQHLSDGAFALSRVLKYAEQIGAALDMAHRHNVIHRDIKPENILLDQDDNAYLTDFGIAQRDDTEQDIDSIAGSVNYMAPELIEGATPTPASDQYSLAIMLYELLTGELPFKANSAAEMLMHHLNDTLPDIRGVVSHMPMSLDPVLSRATSKNPSERYDSIQDFLQAFQEVQGDTDANTLNTTREMYALAENPYKGLRPFDESDAQDFFGRTRLTDQIITRLDEDTAYANFLAVVGPSGSGKSSVVRAGLMPRMRYGDVADTYDWFMADFVPGDNPIDALANALLKVAPSPLPQLRQNLQQDANALLDASMTILQQARGAKLFVFIDQFEELFTLTHNDAIRAHFLEMMRTTVMQTSDVYIVVTVRADFFDKPLMYEGIAEMMQSRTQVVLPLTARELERAIVAPAERVGIIVEPELVAAIVADVREEPGTLPLLQYSLTELFERRDNNKMTFQSYVSVSGVLSSLARRAEEVYEHLSPHQQDTAKQLFLRLVTLGEGTEDTRRRVRRQELFNIQQDRETVEATLDAFGNHRLLTFDRDTSTREPTVEIAHEALINRWYTLQTWLDDSRSDVRLQRSLASAAQEWDEKGRQIGFLLYGGRLIQYSEWAEESSVALTGLESAYLSASITEKEKRDQAEQERAEREQRLQQRVLQRTRIFAGAVSVAVLIAIGLATISFQLSQVAQDERDNAERAQLTSDANARTAEQQLEEIQNFNLVNQAQQAIQNGDSGFALSILNFVNHDALAPIVQRNVYDIAYTSQVRDRILGHTRTVTALAIASDMRYLATASEDMTIILWDMATNEQLTTLTGHEGIISELVFTPDNTGLVSSANDGLVIIWDIESSSASQTLRGHRNVVTGVDVSADGRMIASSSSDDTVILWDSETGEQLYQLEGHSDSVRAVAFSPDSTQVASASRDQSIIIWDTTTGEAVQTLTGHTDSVQTLSYAPDGTSLLSGAFDNVIIQWDTATGNVMNRLLGHSDEVTSIAFHPDSTQAVSTSCAERDQDRICIQGEIILWDLASGRPLRELNGHAQMVNDIAITSDGQQIITGSCGVRRESSCIEGEALIWDVDATDDTFQRLTAHTSSVFSVATTQDGTMLASGGGSVALADQSNADTDVILYDIATGEVLNRYQGHTGNVTALAFHPTENVLVSTSRDTTVRVWSLESLQEINILDAHTSTVYDLTFSADGTRLVTAGDFSVRLWDYPSSEQILTLEDFGAQIAALSVAIHPDGTQIAAGFNNGTVSIWSAETGELIQRINAHTDDVVSIAFDSTGTQLITASNDRSIGLWDVGTGDNVVRLRGHEGALTDAVLSPDGNTILSASEDNTLRLWDIATGEVIRIFAQHNASVLDIATFSDGNLAYSASADGSVIGWRISLDAVLAWVDENRYTRDITPEELNTIRPVTDE